jgi:hypothetical protein
LGARSGQAVLRLVAAMAAVPVGAMLLGAIAKGIGKDGREQHAADLGALAGERAMRSAYTRLFERADLCGQAQRQHSSWAPTRTWAVPPRLGSPAPTAPRTSRSRSPTVTPSRPCASASPSASVPQ